MTDKPKPTLYEIALVKSYSFTQEYNRYTGKVEDRPNYQALKEGYIEGFLAGVAFRLNGGTNGSD